MSKRMIWFFILITVGSVAIVALYFLTPIFDDIKQKETSDARATKGTITIGMDNWVGYFPLCSRELKKRMRGTGYLVKCVDDNADYSSRMKELGDGNIDFAVATVDSGILNGAPYNFPGTIVMVIDKSVGADAVLAIKDKISSLDDLKKKEFKIAFTPASPSEHLLKSTGAHFDISKLREKKGKWRVETNGSPEALKKLLARKVDAAVLWEPDVSRALANPGVIKLLGTEDTEKLIVDILLVNRDFSQDQPDTVYLLLSEYFQTLKWYSEHHTELVKEVSETTKLKPDQVEAMLKGVSWVNLTANASQWFGVGAAGSVAQNDLMDTIESTVGILVDSRDFPESPLPGGDPYRIINSQFVEELFARGVGTQFGKKDDTASPAVTSSLEKKFPQLDDAAWSRLREVGTLRVRPITFQSWNAELGIQDKEELDKAVENLKHYPNFRVVVKGHTGLRGDHQANKALSLDRADAVARYITVTYNVDANRLRVLGMGSEEPLPRRLGEPERAYNYRLPRVEMYLVSEVY